MGGPDYCIVLCRSFGSIMCYYLLYYDWRVGGRTAELHANDVCSLSTVSSLPGKHSICVMLPPPVIVMLKGGKDRQTQQLGHRK